MMHLSPHIALIGVTVLQMSLGAYQAAQIVITATAPPPIDGSATMPQLVQAGETVLVGWDIVKRTDCPGINSRVWHGANGFAVTEAAKPTSLPTSQVSVHYMVPTEIPALAPVGDLRLEIVGSYKCPGADEVAFKLGPVQTRVVPGVNGD